MKIDASVSAIVTGGASGLGLASARALRATGAKVAIFDLNPEAGELAAAELGAVFCQADVTSEESLDAAFQKARAAHGQERLLIACAGGGNAKLTLGKDRATGELVQFPLADFARVVTLNAMGTFATMTRFAAGAALLEPIDGERGAAVFTASVAAQDGQLGQAAYAAGKSAIIGMTFPIARDLGRYGIRVNTILPGTFDTPAMRRAPQEAIDRLCGMVAFPPRLGDAAEFASLALEMCRNGYLNGQAVRLDAGTRFAAR